MRFSGITAGVCVFAPVKEHGPSPTVQEYDNAIPSGSVDAPPSNTGESSSVILSSAPAFAVGRSLSTITDTVTVSAKETNSPSETNS